MAAATINASAQWLSTHSLALTLALAAVALATEALLQWRSSDRHPLHRAWAATWRTNLLLLAATFAVSWAISPWAAPLLSLLLSGRDGALSLFGWPLAVRLVIGLVLLDFIAFVVHWAEHRFGWWWRLHQVHHSDAAVNASTHFRQHPLSLPLDLAVRLPLLWALGVPAASWVLYALLSNALQLWQHARFVAPMWLERALSPLLVTPRFHRVHHHPTRQVHDQNFGTVLSCWDRLFGTYDARWQHDLLQSATVGLAAVSPEQSVSFTCCLLAPFAAPPSTKNARPAATEPAPRHSKAQRLTRHRRTS